MSNRQKAPGSGLKANRGEDKVESRRKISALLSLVATTLASFGGTYAANSPSDKGPAVTLFHSEAPAVPGTVTGSTIGLHDVFPGKETLPLPGYRVDVIRQESVHRQVGGEWVLVGEPKIKTAEATVSIQMQYAREFDQDPRAREMSDNGVGVEEATQEIKNLVENGYQIDRVVITGFASSEDDHPSGGLDKPSNRNVALAKVRAEVVKDSLVSQLDQMGLLGHISNIKVNGVEALDIELNREIEGIAINKNRPVKEKLEDYNLGRHDSFTKEELETLDGLDKQRRTDTQVFGSKTEIVQTWVYEEGAWVEVLEAQKVFSVVFIPVVVPARSKRRKDDDQPASLEDDRAPEGQGAESGNNKRGAVNALGIPYNPSARRGAIFTADNSVSTERPGTLTPEAVDTIKGIVDNQDDARPLMVPFVRLVEATPIPVAPVTTGPGARPGSNHSRPPKKIGEEVVRKDDVPNIIQQPTFSNNGAGYGINGGGRHRLSATN